MLKRIFIAEPDLGELDTTHIAEAINSGWISNQGPSVKNFEQKFGEWLGTKYGVTTTNGTTALHLALVTLGIGKEDEVIIPAFSMGAIPFSVFYTGAKPVLVDTDWLTWNMNTTKIENKITKKTKAIIVMHTYGHPVDMQIVIEVAKNNGLYIIEDAAEAHGAKYQNKKVGTFGDMSCFSFYANKIITTGEGGMIVTDSSKLAERARFLGNMAFDQDPSRKFLHKQIGYNYRLTNIQASLGLAQLKRINEFIKIRRRNAKKYNHLLNDIEGIILPPEASYAKNVYWMYSILIEKEKFGINRNNLIKILNEKYKIETRPFFVPIHQQPAFSSQYKGENYPIAERLSNMGINLPSGNTLTERQVEIVADAIREIAQN